ncbi:hypothetical protein PGTUg99_035776 [Puccinia graminis f. sp. tritici]|uniref:Uncharacterized protein n=1 Tax=Puccinia graminis f. sp. tritici TaxID=56615 RepID=A0A5B0SNS7_PUCGR|nr:hypothetical protein PGTUg99_035776 [Puccinia graminis f. sp. tritici]
MRSVKERTLLLWSAFLVITSSRAFDDCSFDELDSLSFLWNPEPIMTLDDIMYPKSPSHELLAQQPDRRHTSSSDSGRPDLLDGEDSFNREDISNPHQIHIIAPSAQRNPTFPSHLSQVNNPGGTLAQVPQEKQVINNPHELRNVAQSAQQDAPKRSTGILAKLPPRKKLESRKRAGRSGFGSPSPTAIRALVEAYHPHRQNSHHQPNQQTQPGISTFHPNSQDSHGQEDGGTWANKNQMDVVPQPRTVSRNSRLIDDVPGDSHSFLLPAGPSQTKIFMEENPSEVHQMNIDRFEQILSTLESGQLRAEEEKFFDLYYGFSQTTSKKEKAWSASQRTGFLRQMRNEFRNQVGIWYNRWRQHTTIDVEKYIDSMTKYECQKIVPVYLFYVEMIRSIVPRPGVEREYSKELGDALRSFSRLIQLVIHRDKLNQTNLDRITINKAITLSKQLQASGGDSFNAILWTFLEFWMLNHRRSLLRDHSTNFVLDINPKSFFNSVFCCSFRNLNKLLAGK